MITLDTIYKRTSTGAIQIWYGQLDGEGRYRTVSGQIDGKHTISEWTLAEAKNVGRANATTAAEQADFELRAKYKDRLSKDYFSSINDVDQIRFVAPMLADKWADRKKEIRQNELLFPQPKLDGYRAVAQVVGGRVKLLSRNGKPFGGVRVLEEHLQSLFDRNPGLILDGEIYNHSHKDEFEELGSCIKKEPKTQELRDRANRVMQYHVYDIPSLANENYAVRFAELDQMFDTEPELMGDRIWLIENRSIIWNEEGRAEFEQIVSEFLENGYEGAIVRRNTPYEFKRTKNLLKVKDFIDEEFEIVGIEEGKGNWVGCAKRVFIAVPNAPVSHGDRIINRETNTIEKFDGSQKSYHRCSKATPKGSQDRMRQILQNPGDYIGGFSTLTYFRITNDGVPYLPIIKTLKRIDDPRN